MSDPNIVESGQVVEMLEAGRFIQFHREHIRKILQYAWKRSLQPREFIDHAMPIAETIIQIGSLSQKLTQMLIGDSSAKNVEGRIRTSVETEYLVLFFIINQFVTEDTSDTDDWKAMEHAVRTRLVEVRTILEAMNRFIRDSKLDEYTKQHSDEIETRLLEACRTFIQEKPDVAFNQLSDVALSIFLVDAENQENVLQGLRSQSVFDPTMIATRYILLYLLETIQINPSLELPCSYFKKRTFQLLENTH
jgi:hypothetical protein